MGFTNAVSQLLLPGNSSQGGLNDEGSALVTADPPSTVRKIQPGAQGMGGSDFSTDLGSGRRPEPICCERSLPPNLVRSQLAPHLSRLS
eukprot:3261703-Prymnesium_polylepis.1